MSTEVPVPVDGPTETVDWWAAAVASEDPEYLATFWYPRAEKTLTFGSKWFDANLNPLKSPCGELALEVRLIRDPNDAVCRARLEIRTGLAFSTVGSTHAMTKKLVDIIAAAQRELAERAGVSFAPPSRAKPHVLTAGRGLLRSYGKGSVFSMQTTAQGFLRAYGLLVSVWRAALIHSGSATIARVRALAEHAIAADNLDMRYLFAAPGDGAAASEARPGLTDELLVRVGLAIGCSRTSDGRYAKPAEEIEIAERPPPGVIRMVAEDIATTHGVKVDSVLHKVLLPMLRGEFNGFVINCTDVQAGAIRAAMKERQVPTPSEAEN